MGSSSSIISSDSDNNINNSSLKANSTESSTSIRTAPTIPVSQSPQTPSLSNLLKSASFFRLSSSNLNSESKNNYINNCIKSEELNSSLNKSKILIQNTTSSSQNNVNNNKEQSTTRKAGSVRQIALINHSKQEHEYIRVEDVSLHFSAKESPTKPDKKESLEESLSKSVIDNYKKDNKQDDKNDAQYYYAPARVNNNFNYILEEDENEDNQKFTLNKIQNFKSSLNLKINLDDDGSSSENENENENDCEEHNIYDDRLIEVPQESHEPESNKPDSNKISTLKVDIVGASITENGIVRPNEESTMLDVSVSMDITSDNFVLNDSMSKPSSPNSVPPILIHKPTKVSNGGVKRLRVKLPLKERLLIVGKLGAGASSVVYKALDVIDMRLVALKVIKVHDQNKRVQMMTEVSTLFAMIKDISRRESSNLPKGKRADRYIVDFYDAFVNPEEQTVSFMMEYMDGKSLQDIVDQGGCENEHTLANIAVQALKGLQFLHNASQLHRDIKPANFLITHRGEVKLADLGLVKQLKTQNSKDPLGRTNSFVGTAVFFSPEKINGNSYSYGSDVWAFGLSMLLIALGHFPDTFVNSGNIQNRDPSKVVGMGYWQLVQAINDESLLKYISNMNFSNEFKDFLSCCLQKDESKRSTCKELLRHPYIVSKVVSEDLTYNQSYDRGIKEFLSIISSLVEHIKMLKKLVKNTYNSEKDYMESKIYPHHIQTFGNIWKDSIKEIFTYTLFPETDSTATRSRKPRLTKLANQLHLPLDKLTSEAKKFIENL